jgi:hypothetical protein
MTHHTPNFWSYNGVSFISGGLVADQTPVLLGVGVTREIKPRLIRKTRDVQNIIPTRSNIVCKPQSISTLLVVPSFLFMR